MAMQPNFHFLFEQSGTFKNIFKEFGHEAWDYDILNDYGETDLQIDLFEQINHTYNYLTAEKIDLEKVKNETIYRLFFDMKPNKDFIFAFFPCTYFSDMNEMIFKSSYKKQIQNGSISNVLKRIDERTEYFKLFLKLCFVVDMLKIPTIIENPSSPIHRSYLELYSPYRPSWREKDRTLFGDHFRKPTNFFAINFEMKENFMMFDEEHFKKSIKRKKRVKEVYVESNQKKRSEITPRYARNFYKRFIEKYVESLKEKSKDF